MATYNDEIAKQTIEGFGEEWKKFDQTELTEQEELNAFNAYFSIFPWKKLPNNAEGFDMGCGSGRWAKLVAPEVGKLHCIDPSSAIDVAKRNLNHFKNCHFHKASIDEIPLEDESMDFGYCLGVLHHIPNTEEGIKNCVKKLKPNAPFLVYIYYAFDNRPWWYRFIWKLSDVLRRFISKLPFKGRYWISQIIALLVYYPLARTAKMVEKLGVDVSNFPLRAYRNRSLYFMRTDALDRFGTKLEKRFTKQEIKKMMENSGLTAIKFSDQSFWSAVGFKNS